MILLYPVIGIMRPGQYGTVLFKYMIVMRTNHRASMVSTCCVVSTPCIVLGRVLMGIPGTQVLVLYLGTWVVRYSDSIEHRSDDSNIDLYVSLHYMIICFRKRPCIGSFLL